MKSNSYKECRICKLRRKQPLELYETISVRTGVCNSCRVFIPDYISEKQYFKYMKKYYGI